MLLHLAFSCGLTSASLKTLPLLLPGADCSLEACWVLLHVALGCLSRQRAAAASLTDHNGDFRPCSSSCSTLAFGRPPHFSCQAASLLLSLRVGRRFCIMSPRPAGKACLELSCNQNIQQRLSPAAYFRLGLSGLPSWWKDNVLCTVLVCDLDPGPGCAYMSVSVRV